MDPRVGEIEVYQVQKFANRPSGSKGSRTKIPLKDCREVSDDSTWQIIFSSTKTAQKLRDGILLCPDSKSLEIQGKYDDQVFTYIAIILRACNATIEGSNCYNPDQVNH